MAGVGVACRLARAEPGAGCLSCYPLLRSCQIYRRRRVAGRLRCVLAPMPGEVAAGRPGVTATILYTRTSGPLKNRHARELAGETIGNGGHLLMADRIPLHGKFVAWDRHDLVVASLNLASAATDPDLPCGDIGVHVRMAGVADAALAKLVQVFPQLTDSIQAWEAVSGWRQICGFHRKAADVPTG